MHAVPVLFWFTITDAHHVEGFAQLGVVFLLFLIGLGMVAVAPLYT